MINSAARYLIIAGIILVLTGAVILFFDRIPGGKMPWFGRLPGDIIITRPGFSFYFPVTTCILISILISAILYVFFRK